MRHATIIQFIGNLTKLLRKAKVPELFGKTISDRSDILSKKDKAERTARRGSPK